jgi:hypothetical protein
MCQVTEIGQMHDRLWRKPPNTARRREGNIKMEFVQSASKMLGHTSSVVSSNKENSSYKHMSVNERFFLLNYKITFNSKLLNYGKMVNFTLYQALKAQAGVKV